MKTIKTLTIALIAVILNSCGLNDDFQTVVIKDRYAVSIPSFLSETTNLNTDASLQYQNPLRELYIIVIDETREDFQKALDDNDLNETYSADLKGYSDLLIKSFEQSLTNIKKSAVLDTTVKGLPVRSLTMSGHIDNVEVCYEIAFVKGKNHYYQVMTWTLLSKEATYKDKMRKMIYSLEERRS